MGGHRASGAGGADADLVDGPVDLAAVRADDALIDALAGGTGAAPGGADYGFGLDSSDDDQLAAILAAWRADIEADPMPELVTLDEAGEAVAAGHESRDRLRSRTRRRMPFAIAAAAAVVACAGLTVAVHGAMPGDTLWGVSKVFFAERAGNVERVEDVRGHIEAANAALGRGDAPAARAALQQADVVLPQIVAEEAAPLVADRDRVQSSINAEPTAAPSGPSSSAPTTAPGSSATGKSPSPTSPKPDGSTAGDPAAVSPADPDPADAPETRGGPDTVDETPPLSSTPVPPPGG